MTNGFTLISKLPKLAMHSLHVVVREICIAYPLLHCFNFGFLRLDSDLLSSGFLGHLVEFFLQNLLQWRVQIVFIHLSPCILPKDQFRVLLMHCKSIVLVLLAVQHDRSVLLAIANKFSYKFFFFHLEKFVMQLKLFPLVAILLRCVLLQHLAFSRLDSELPL